VPDLPDDPERDWLTAPDPDRTPVERYLAEAVRFHHVTDLQKAILARTDAIIASGLSMYLEGLTRTGPPGHLTPIFEESQARSRDRLLSNPLALPLPGLPRASGESRDFARLIRDRLEEFQSHRPLFSSLVVPVTLTLRVTAGKKGLRPCLLSSEKGNGLDGRQAK
jgi:hypothetical protein